MKPTTVPLNPHPGRRASRIRAFKSGLVGGALTLAAVLSCTGISLADEGGVSFWVPGFFGSLAATPQQPGWSLANIDYNTNVSAGSGVALAREFEIRNLPLNIQAQINASLHANATLNFVVPTYVFATPVLGGQFSLSALEAYGHSTASLSGNVSGTVTGPLGTAIPFGPRFDAINSSVWGFSDFIPMAALKWNSGVNNYMIYATGDVPIGAYDSSRLANIGIGHGAFDAGAGYTYFDPQAGHEFSGVLGFTANFINPATQYQSGVDMHFDWAASQFLTKQLLVGLVGYAYKDIGCDSGSGDRVGCFQSQVVGVGPQVGILFPVAGMQGYLNLKAYGEFDGSDRPSGWNAWVTLSISPAAPSASAAPTSHGPLIYK
jgi:hypothetical protein